METIQHFGGLHRFMNWSGPILTDSGGYQIFSLARLRKITPEGVHFQNHVDGTPAFISPEIAMQIQATLGSDIAMVLDECPPWPCDYEYAARSLDMTIEWARRCKDAVVAAVSAAKVSDAAKPATITDAAGTAATTGGNGQLAFGIVQGATFADLRQKSAEALVQIGFDGYAVGGVSVGEPEEEMMRAIESSTPFLPAEKPRYAMGLGTPPQMIEMVARGIDMFDCVLPTRLARNGTAFTAAGTLNLKNAEFALQKQPIEEGCTCPACAEFTRGYIRHLIKAEEILGLRLITLHNLHFYLSLMKQVRHAIEAGTFAEFRESVREWLQDAGCGVVGELTMRPGLRSGRRSARPTTAAVIRHNRRDACRSGEQMHRTKPRAYDYSRQANSSVRFSCRAGAPPATLLIRG